MAFNNHILEYRGDGVYLTIKEGSQPTDSVFKETMARLSRKEVKGVAADGVNMALKQRGTAQKIAEAQAEKLVDGGLSVIISRDAMTAECRIIEADGGAPLYIERAKQLLAEAGVVFGVDDEALAAAISGGKHGDFTVACGLAPQNGANATIEYHFDLSTTIAPKLLENGRVDYKDLGFVRSVHAGDRLATYTPATDGQPGMNVRGVPIACKRGRDKKFVVGKNVSIVDNVAVADIDGRPEYANNRITVLNVLEINENVSNATGNIDFPGSVVIRGGVYSNFTVKAAGSVTVSGAVEAAVIEAGGDIILQNGIQGGGRGTLISGGSIIAKFVENATLKAQGDVRSDTLMHSHIESGGKVVVVGKKGIMGGSVNAAVSVSAPNIGSISYAQTSIEVGLSPSIRARQVEIAKELKVIEVEMPKLQTGATLFIKLAQRGPLPPDKLEALKKIKARMDYYKVQLERLGAEQKEFEEISGTVADGKVHIKDNCYPNVKIIMGRYSRTTENNYTYTTFKLRENEIEAFTYEGAEL